MNAPDTGLIKTLRVGGGRVWWRSPSYVGGVTDAGVPNTESASVVWRPTAGDQTTALTPAWSTLTITGQHSRGQLTVDLPSDAMAGALPWGDAWLYTAHNGVIPVRIGAVVDHGPHYDVTLVDRLKYDLDLNGGARLQSQLWYADETTAAVVSTATRTASGNAPIPYSIAWGVLEPANPAGAGAITAAVRRIEGRLNVVRQQFDTGLTSDGVRARYPELARMSQAGGAGLEAAIYAEGQALELMVTSAVREAGASPYTFADDVSGDAFTEAHAAMVAARVVESTRPEQADRYRQRADVFFQQGLAVAWADLNRDGVVDSGEDPALIGFATSSKGLPSVVPTRTAWWTVGERR